MQKISWKKVNFEDIILHLQGKTLIEKWKEINWPEEAKETPQLYFLNDGSVICNTSDAKSAAHEFEPDLTLYPPKWWISIEQCAPKR